MSNAGREAGSLTPGAVAFGIAVVTAVLTYMGVGLLGLVMLMATWPGYAEATSTKTYSLAMLFARLAVALLSALFAGLAAGRISGMRAAWVAGAVLVVAAGWIHLVQVWPDYPAWYHAAYVLPIAPTVAAAAWPFARRRPNAR